MDRNVLLVGSILASSLFAAPSFAQIANSATNSNDEIIVTAQRRAENVTDVPIAMNVMSAEQMQSSGIVDTGDLGQLTPGLNMTWTGAFFQPTLRGIGTTVSAPGADNNVTVYVDGVVQPNQVSGIFEFNNIERIEVLKGPQGTLFGRNATGGAISITTREPTAEPMAKATVGYGSFDEKYFNAYASAGVDGIFAVDLSVFRRKNDGYMKNIFLDTKTASIDSTGIRSKILFTPTDNLKLTVALGWSESDNNASFAVKPLNGNTTTTGYLPTTGPFQVATDTDPRIYSETHHISGHLEWDLDVGTLTAIGSFANVDTDPSLDSDATNLPNLNIYVPVDEDDTSAELNFATREFGNFSALLGLYYFHSDVFGELQGSPGDGAPLFLDIATNTETTAKAIYGELYWQALDSLRFIAGLRYSHEKKSLIYTRGAQVFLDAGLLSTTWDDFTPRFSAIYEINPTTNIYATFSQGFKSGAYNAYSAQFDPVAPEKVTAYEVGLKHGERGLSYNFSAYYYDYKDIQVQQFTGQVTSAFLTNAGSAEIYGFDADITASLADHWTVNAGVAYNHGRYGDYPGAPLFTPNPIPPGGNTLTIANGDGKTVIRAPEWSVNMGVTYEHELPVGGIELTANAAYKSKAYWDVNNAYAEPGYILINARASWDINDNFGVAVWGKNLADEVYAIYEPVNNAATRWAVGRPRSFGVELYFNFN